VEDDENDVLLIRIALETILSGVPISVVTNGVEAVEYLRGGGRYLDRSVHPFPDVVLLDLMLPLMNGVEVLRWIRQQPELKLLPVVGLTGSLRNEDTRLACEAGANLCALKSQGFRRLAEIVMQVSGAGLNNAQVAEPVSSAEPHIADIRPQEVGGLAGSDSVWKSTIQPAQGGGSRLR